jgi:hypothetical protein
MRQRRDESTHLHDLSLAFGPGCRSMRLSHWNEPSEWRLRLQQRRDESADLHDLSLAFGPGCRSMRLSHWNEPREWRLRLQQRSAKSTDLHASVHRKHRMQLR